MSQPTREPPRPPPDVIPSEERIHTAITDALSAVARLPPAVTDRRGLIRRHNRRLDVWADNPPGTDARAATIAGGCTLDDLLSALAAHGAHGILGRFPHPERPSLLATVLVEDWRPPRPTDVDLFADLSRRCRPAHRSSVARRGFLTPIDGLQRRAAVWSVRLTAVPAPNGRGRRLVLWSTDDGPAAWLASGEALTNLLTDLLTAGACPTAEISPEPAIVATLRVQIRQPAFVQVVVDPGPMHLGY